MPTNQPRIDPTEPARINPYVPSGVVVAGAPVHARDDEGTDIHDGLEPRPLNAAREPDPWARYLNLALGIWLVISAFAWEHSAAAMTNTWIVGALVAVSAAAALVFEPVRWVTAALAIWLFASTFAYADRPATLWHNVAIAVVLFLCALVPGSVRTPTGRPHVIGRV